MVSRFGHGHCKHLGGQCGEPNAWPTLDKYAAAGNDLLGLGPFFNAYVRPDTPRTFPVVVLNYHRLWDNLPAAMRAMGLPEALAATFPQRTETVRNDQTGKRENNKAHTEETREGLRRMYQPITDAILGLPAVSVV